jgi:tetratricopeptide (TPR) repeat protein
MGNFEEAVAHYLRATEIKEDPGAYNNLGCALKKLNLFQDAIYAFNDSLALQPSAETANNLITLYIELGKIEEAKNLVEISSKLLTPADLKVYSKYLDESKSIDRRLTFVIPSKSLLGSAIKRTADSRRSVLSSVTPTSKLTPRTNMLRTPNP